MEACGSARHWASWGVAQSIEVRLLPRGTLMPDHPAETRLEDQRVGYVFAQGATDTACEGVRNAIDEALPLGIAHQRNSESRCD
jgi:hypothetical protein